MNETESHVVPYDRAQREIRDADLLLFRRGRGLVDRMIAASGRSLYVHAAMAAWWRDDLMCLETLQLRDGRAVCLAGQVARFPGRWDVYETNPDDRLPFDRVAAVRTMKRFTGTRYGWWNVLRIALRRLPIARWLVRPVTDDLADGTHPPFCSQAVAIACRAGGVDPVPNLADRLTEPGDLARSPFFRYRFTLASASEEGKGP
jgi:hypothetical protein